MSSSGSTLIAAELYSVQWNEGLQLASKSSLHLHNSILWAEVQLRLDPWFVFESSFGPVLKASEVYFTASPSILKHQP